MEHAINLHGHGPTDIGWIADVAFDKANSPVVDVRLNEADIAAGEVVNDHHVVAASHKPVDEMGADEAGASGHQRSHGRTTKSARIREMVPVRNRIAALIIVQVVDSGSGDTTSEEVNT